MRSFDLETWDHDRLVVNRAFAPLLQQNGWTTFATIWSRTAEAAIAKKLRSDRITLRFTLSDGETERAFYIKRHRRSHLWEYIKPLLKFRWPILGARNEWDAIIAFHEVGLPTMIPVAYGKSGSDSFLITEALEGCTKLSELSLLRSADNSSESGLELHSTNQRRNLINRVAELTRRMHQAGLHHQDYYLGHLMLSNRDLVAGEIYIIDLGRVQRQVPLATRWIVKDLAQLNYSARSMSATDRMRFLQEYFGHDVGAKEKKLITQILAKTAAIARHSKKNQL